VTQQNVYFLKINCQSFYLKAQASLVHCFSLCCHALFLRDVDSRCV